MIFQIDDSPPDSDTLENERAAITNEIKSISTRDTLITFILIICISLAAGLAVYESTDNVRYAGIAAAIFPVLGIVMSLLGVTRVIGFRSAAYRLAELKSNLIALNPVSDNSINDINTLRSKYQRVDDYQKQVEAEGRPTVNGELAMYWEFDASTSAKSARGRDYLIRAQGQREVQEQDDEVS